MIQPYDTGYIVRYTQVIITKKGTTVPVPVYGGQGGSITGAEMVRRHGRLGVRSGEHLVGNMVIPVKNGNVGRTMGDILKFYRKSLLKETDLADPAVVGFEGKSPAIVCYDFTCRGLPCSMMISVKPKEHKGESSRHGIIFIRIFLGSTVESLNLHGTCR